MKNSQARTGHQRGMGGRETDDLMGEGRQGGCGLELCMRRLRVCGSQLAVCLVSLFCVCVSLVRVVIICPASTHTALVSSPSLAVLHLSTYLPTWAWCPASKSHPWFSLASSPVLPPHRCLWPRLWYACSHVATKSMPRSLYPSITRPCSRSTPASDVRTMSLTDLLRWHVDRKARRIASLSAYHHRAVRYGISALAGRVQQRSLL